MRARFILAADATRRMSDIRMGSMGLRRAC